MPKYILPDRKNWMQFPRHCHISWFLEVDIEDAEPHTKRVNFALSITQHQWCCSLGYQTDMLIPHAQQSWNTDNIPKFPSRTVIFLGDLLYRLV